MASNTEAVGASAAVPTDVGLKRDMGFIGATWASETSIIGSGWLFGAFLAAQAAGTAALLGWVIAGVIVIILALVHAELGGMYPVSGGTARFPHFAFGSIAGISFGFFSWLQAVTVAPIECFAVMQYGSYYWHGLYDANTSNVTGLGFAMTVVLLAVFTAINFLAMRLFSKVNAGITWWKVAIPVITIIILLFKFHPNNLGAGGGFMPYGIKALFAAIPSAGIVFAYLGFEQADQLAGEIKNPQKNLPRAILTATGIGILIYVLLQFVFIGAIPHSLISGPKGWAAIPSTSPIAIGPFAGLAGVVGLGTLAVFLRIDAFVSPFGTGLMYQTSTSRIGYGLARNRYFPQLFQKVDRNGVPWFSLIIAFLAGLLFLLPFPSWHSLVGLVTSAERADVRRGAAVAGRLPRAGARSAATVPDAGSRGGRAARVLPGQHADLLVGFRGDLEARHLRRHWLRADRHLHGLRPAAAAAGLEVRTVAALLSDRHGHHLLAGPVQRRGLHATAEAAHQHRQHPVLVGHPGRLRVQHDHLLLGAASAAVPERNARHGQPAVRNGAGPEGPLTRTDGS